jgi:hypothetical protein
MKILRVFPRRTAATPEDDLVRVGYPDLFPPECDEIRVSVTFTYDLPKAEKMAEAWGHIAPVKIGGPALNDAGGDFVPGRYLKQGYVITSRGCPNRCWFCMAAKREGDIRELPITEGWNVLDNNLLACSPDHVYRVFEMLSRQSRRAEFTGGLEAARLTPKMACRLALLNPKRIYFAYDTPNDKAPLAEAARTLWATGMKPSSHIASAYVLIGYPHDAFAAAEERLMFVLSLGILPFAMLYRDEAGKVDQKWRRFQREWCRPTIVGLKLAEARP